MLGLLGRVNGIKPIYLKCNQLFLIEPFYRFPDRMDGECHLPGIAGMDALYKGGCCIEMIAASEPVRYRKQLDAERSLKNPRSIQRRCGVVSYEFQAFGEMKIVIGTPDGKIVRTRDKTLDILLRGFEIDRRNSRIQHIHESIRRESGCIHAMASLKLFISVSITLK